MDGVAGHERFPPAKWSAILAVVTLARATSYHYRTPSPTAAADAIEGAVGYELWALILAAAGALVIVGLATQRRHRYGWIALFAGHTVSVGCYLTFSYSLAWAVVTDAVPWAGLAPLVLVALLHIERLIAIGAEHGRTA